MKWNNGKNIRPNFILCVFYQYFPSINTDLFLVFSINCGNFFHIRDIIWVHMVVNSSLSCKPNYLLINYTSRANEFTQNVNQRELSANFETTGMLAGIRPNLRGGF